MFKSLNDIRSIFIDFFKSKDHYFLKSSSLVPKDNSLLFTNAGMNQFKNIFLGFENIKYNNIVTIQRCLRVGGKHNDIKNIGYTLRHNTFFEMMGNFSFDNYFKELSIIYSWELLTSKKYFFLSKNKIIVTVNINDKESYNIWVNKIKISLNNIFLVGEINSIDNININSDNFWRMSDYGPCGYSTEIFYNINNIKDNKNFILYKDTNKYLEIWNLVFIEYNIDNNNFVSKLISKSVDTGMGLERITSVIQNVNSNYKIDVFKDIKFFISNFLNIKIKKSNEYIFNIISDHIRTIVNLIIDGILPSNEYRGYILRKIIRRTLVYIKLLNVNKIILYNLVFYLKEIFYKFYLIDLKKFIYIKKIIKIEEENFFNILLNGINILNYYIFNLNKKKKKILKGDIIFLLYDTYGLSIDIIIDICKYNKIFLDIKKFNILLDNQKNKSKINSIFYKKNINLINIKNIKKTNFLGYLYKNCNSKVLAIFKNNLSVNYILNNNKENDIIYILLSNTVLFPESGGQKGDIGYIYTKDKLNKFIINKTKLLGEYILHIGYIDYGKICINDNVEVLYNKFYRNKISCNHSCLHIFFYCLKKYLSNEIIQHGSCIKDNYFTFDFFCNIKINKNKLFKIVKIVNIIIWKNLIFYEKNYNNFNKDKNYCFFNKSNNLRLVYFKNNNINIKEYCCGTHVSNTSKIGFFYIIDYYNISNGIKRIKACTNIFSLNYMIKNFFYFKNISNFLSINYDNIFDSIKFLVKKKNKYIKEKNNILYSFIDNIINIISIKDILNYLDYNFLIKKILNFYINNNNILFLIFSKLMKMYNLSIIVICTFYKKKKYYIVCSNIMKIKNINFNWLDIFLDFKKHKNSFKNKEINIDIFLNKNSFDKELYFNKINNFIKFNLNIK